MDSMRQTVVLLWIAKGHFLVEARWAEKHLRAQGLEQSPSSIWRGLLARLLIPKSLVPFLAE